MAAQHHGVAWQTSVGNNGISQLAATWRQQQPGSDGANQASSEMAYQRKYHGVCGNGAYLGARRR